MTRRRLSLAYLMVLIAITIWLVVDRGPAMARLVSDAKPWSLLVLVVASMLPFLANTAFWALALRELGETVTWRQVNEAAIATTLTRYLPGGIWLAAGRSVALARRGVSTPALVAMVGLEVILATPVALLVGSVLLAGSPQAPNWIGWLAAGLLIAAVALARPILNRSLSWWANRRNQPPPRKLTAAGVGRLTFALSVYWLTFGTVFWAYLRAMEQSVEWLASVGSFALSWRIGLFAVIAPQGLGVFEPAFVALIGWSADALLVVGAFRVVILIRDLALTGVAAATRSTID